MTKISEKQHPGRNRLLWLMASMFSACTSVDCGTVVVGGWGGAAWWWEHIIAALNSEQTEHMYRVHGCALCMHLHMHGGEGTL